jgi:hypothetical protein
MLYDPAPLNDPGDPGHDMSGYAARCGADGADFSYRRDRRALRDVRLLLDAPLTEAAFEVTGGRRLQSAVEADWRQRMVFYAGDERAFYQRSHGSCMPDRATHPPRGGLPR